MIIIFTGFKLCPLGQGGDGLKARLVIISRLPGPQSVDNSTCSNRSNALNPFFRLFTRFIIVPPRSLIGQVLHLFVNKLSAIIVSVLR